jgi:hypothetical protein
VEEARKSCHVAVIGDSFVEAAQVSISEKFYSIFKNLADKNYPEKKIISSAYGFSGTGQLNQLAFYDEFIARRFPKLVVLVFFDNDFINNSSVLEAIRNGNDPDHQFRVQAYKNSDGAFEIQPIDPEWYRYAYVKPELSNDYIPKFLRNNLSWIQLRSATSVNLLR